VSPNYRVHRCSLLSQHCDAQRRGRQHSAIISSVANCNGLIRAQVANIFYLCGILVLARKDNQAAGNTFDLIRAFFEGVPGQYVNLKPLCQTFQARPDSGAQVSIARKGTIVIQNEMFQLQRSESGNFDFDYFTVPRN